MYWTSPLLCKVLGLRKNSCIVKFYEDLIVLKFFKSVQNRLQNVNIIQFTFTLNVTFCFHYPQHYLTITFTKEFNTRSQNDSTFVSTRFEGRRSPAEVVQVSKSWSVSSVLHKPFPKPGLDPWVLGPGTRLMRVRFFLKLIPFLSSRVSRKDGKSRAFLKFPLRFLWYLNLDKHL